MLAFTVCILLQCHCMILPMSPSPSKQIGNPVKVSRRVFCAHYQDCLDLAVTRHWDGFTCESCGDYQQLDTTTAAVWQVQAERCGRLLRAIFVDRPRKRSKDY